MQARTVDRATCQSPTSRGERIRPGLTTCPEEILVAYGAVANSIARWMYNPCCQKNGGAER